MDVPLPEPAVAEELQARVGQEGPAAVQPRKRKRGVEAETGQSAPAAFEPEPQSQGLRQVPGLADAARQEAAAQAAERLVAGAAQQTIGVAHHVHAVHVALRPRRYNISTSQARKESISNPLTDRREYASLELEDLEEP